MEPQNIVITGEGDTIAEAREKAKSKLPKDYGEYGLSETIIQDAKPVTKRYTAVTIAEAYKEAKKELDKNAKIIEKKEVETPEKKVISISATSGKAARTLAKSRINDNKFIIKNVKTLVPGKKGFLGIGKVMGEYEFKFFRPAEVEVTYNQKAAVSISLFNTAKINNQLWMQRNLDVDHYSNGDPIPEVKDEKEWSKLKTGAWCYYENEAKNGMKYGKLYNWYAVNDKRGLAPKGWHIPTFEEFEQLESSVKGDGNALKAIGQGTGAGAGTNTIGFSALLSGYRYNNGTFYNLGNYAYFWSSSELLLLPQATCLCTTMIAVSTCSAAPRKTGFSVRCVQD